MRIALGVHVGTYEVVASLVDIEFPQLGPVASRTVQVATAPGGIAGAVSSALGFMRIQAAQNDLLVVGAAVVCEDSLQRLLVADALAESEPEPVLVLDIFDPRLVDGYSPDVAAALLAAVVEPAVSHRVVRPEERRGFWPATTAAACALAALGVVTAWAVTTQSPAEPTGVIPVEAVHPTPVSPAAAAPTVVPGSVAAEPVLPVLEPTAEIVIVRPPVYTPFPMTEVSPPPGQGVSPGQDVSSPVTTSVVPPHTTAITTTTVATTTSASGGESTETTTSDATSQPVHAE
ncbi:hypothetical protein [Rhodococcoides yunnanense]|uniref:hypothetical protein n=1 Tax=Rhodococcoides yunnanense TaxID=278209 RepID=UPI000933458D|nr:hypothetical protein [Rhodococcus yunnanensis]